MTPEREAQIRAKLKVVISHIEADMALDLLDDLDRLRTELEISQSWKLCVAMDALVEIKNNHKRCDCMDAPAIAKKAISKIRGEQ